MSSDPPFVSVVIPCHNEGQYIDACVRSLIDGTYPADRMEVLVVDGDSIDGTRATVERICAEGAPVRVLANPDRVTPRALNRGILAARGAVIVRCDAHARYPRDYIAQLVHALRTTGAACVGGRRRHVPARSTVIGIAIAECDQHPLVVGNAWYRTAGDGPPRDVDTVWPGCWPRRVFDEIGLFDESLARSQDFEFSQRLRRAGGRIVVVPSLEAEYYSRSGLGEVVRYHARNGYWAGLSFLAAHLRPAARHFAPAALVAAIGLALTPLRPIRLAAVTALLVYSLLVMLASVHVGVRARRISVGLAAALLIPMMHVSYGLGTVAGLPFAIRVRRHRNRQRSHPLRPPEVVGPEALPATNGEPSLRTAPTGPHDQGTGRPASRPDP